MNLKCQVWKLLKTQGLMYSLLSAIYLLCISTNAFAAHPLITDDTGTQGAGKFQIEVNGEYSDNNGEKTTEVAVTLSAGISDNIDVVASMPYLFLNPEEDSNEDGFGDAGVEIKWRIYEKEGISFALKPGITFNTGDEDKGLGDGKPSYGIVFITTKEMDALALHFNVGYTRNRKELRDIWHYSFAGEYSFTEKLKAVGNIGGETNPDRTSSTHPLFLLGGLIYNIRENVDIDIGIKTGLNKAETDYAILTGIAFRF